MKRINLSLLAIIASSNFVYAGGDIMPVELEQEVVDIPVEIPAPPPPPPPPAPPPPPPPPPPPVVKDIDVNGLYVALGLTAAQFDPSCSCPGKGDRDRTAGFVGRVGYDFNEYVGLEARGIRTNWKSEGGKIKHAGAFLKPMYPVSEAINVYGLAGYAKTTTAGGARQYVNAKGLAWGAGLEYDLSSDVAKDGKYDRTFDGYGDQEGGFGLFADYERLIQKSGSPDLDTINVCVTYDF